MNKILTEMPDGYNLVHFLGYNGTYASFRIDGKAYPMGNDSKSCS